MQFESWSEFFAMGGYGFYVWLSFGVSFLSLLGIWLDTKLTKRRLALKVAAELARKARIEAKKTQSQSSFINSESESL